MKIALTTKNYNAKNKKESFMTSLSEGNRNCIKPPGRPPPLPFPLSSPLLSPAVNHPPHAKMKHTGEADALVTEFAARWRARKEHLSKIIFNKIRRKGEQEKDDLLVYIQNKHPNT
jgi:hypothetical protein